MKWSAELQNPLEKSGWCLLPTIFSLNQRDVKTIDMDTVIAIVYILNLAAHLDKYSLIANIFPAVLYFLSRGKEIFF